jgi:hypothetical protein
MILAQEFMIHSELQIAGEIPVALFLLFLAQYAQMRFLSFTLEK